MLTFELRAVTTQSFRQETINEVEKVIFTVTPEVGVVGNTYPFFLNTAKSIEVMCDKSMTGSEMDSKILTDCAAFVTLTFPPLV